MWTGNIRTGGRFVVWVRPPTTRCWAAKSCWGKGEGVVSDVTHGQQRGLSAHRDSARTVCLLVLVAQGAAWAMHVNRGPPLDGSRRPQRTESMQSICGGRSGEGGRGIEITTTTHTSPRCTFEGIATWGRTKRGVVGQRSPTASGAPSPPTGRELGRFRDVVRAHELVRRGVWKQTTLASPSEVYNGGKQTHVGRAAAGLAAFATRHAAAAAAAA